jgi:ketosteroid isomerase-like protein
MTPIPRDTPSTTPESPDDERALAVTRRFLDARAAGDLDGAAGLVTADAVWHSPVEGPQRGRAAVREALAAACRDTDWFRFTVERLELRAPGCVLATLVNRGERVGEQLDSRQWLGFTVRDGCIADVKIAVDDPAAVERFWEA